jgi:hypothetical protein
VTNVNEIEHSVHVNCAFRPPPILLVYLSLPLLLLCGLLG